MLCVWLYGAFRQALPLPQHCSLQEPGSAVCCWKWAAGILATAIRRAATDTATVSTVGRTAARTATSSTDRRTAANTATFSTVKWTAADTATPSTVKRVTSAVVSHTAEVGSGGSLEPNHNFLSKAVGECYSVTVTFADVAVPCLLDPGSQVTTVSEEFFAKSLASRGFKLQRIPGTLSLVSASGSAIPYTGYFETDIHALGKTMKSRVVLVIKETSSPPQARGGVHGILGMNVLQQCWEELLGPVCGAQLDKIPWPVQEPAWQKALGTVGEFLSFGDDQGRLSLIHI